MLERIINGLFPRYGPGSWAHFVLPMDIDEKLAGISELFGVGMTLGPDVF